MNYICNYINERKQNHDETETDLPAAGTGDDGIVGGTAVLIERNGKRGRSGGKHRHSHGSRRRSGAQNSLTKLFMEAWLGGVSLLGLPSG